jgi:hypothetical protein
VHVTVKNIIRNQNIFHGHGSVVITIINKFFIWNLYRSYWSQNVLVDTKILDLYFIYFMITTEPWTWKIFWLRLKILTVTCTIYNTKIAPHQTLWISSAIVRKYFWPERVQGSTSFYKWAQLFQIWINKNGTVLFLSSLPLQRYIYFLLTHGEFYLVLIGIKI